MESVQQAVTSIREHSRAPCRVALVLGSGLGELAEHIDRPVRLPFADISGFPVSTAPGHHGQLLLGQLHGVDVVVMQGRQHLYEGWLAHEIALPIRTLRALGAHTLLITNAAGALNPAYRPGDLMLINDHLNLTGANPLIGANDETIGLRYPDMSQAYDPALQNVFRDYLHAQGIAHQSGVYAAITGPSLETSAERRFFRTAGADAIGMSTVIEVIAAVHAGLRVIGLSAISNMATGGADQAPDTIEEVYANAAIAQAKIAQLLPGLLPLLDTPAAELGQ